MKYPFIIIPPQPDRRDCDWEETSCSHLLYGERKGPNHTSNILIFFSVCLGDWLLSCMNLSTNTKGYQIRSHRGKKKKTTA